VNLAEIESSSDDDDYGKLFMGELNRRTSRPQMKRKTGK